MSTDELLDLLRFRRLDRRNCDEESMTFLMGQAADEIEQQRAALADAARPEASPHWCPRSWHDSMMQNGNDAIVDNIRLRLALERIANDWGPRNEQPDFQKIAREVLERRM